MSSSAQPAAEISSATAARPDIPSPPPSYSSGTFTPRYPRCASASQSSVGSSPAATLPRVYSGPKSPQIRATVSRSIVSSCGGISSMEGTSMAAMSCSLPDMEERGYFPAGESVLRHVHEQRAVGLLYGQRALLMQATDSVAFTGLLGHTTGLSAPFKRLARTGQAMEMVFFGSRAEADRITDRVRKMHSRVRWATDDGAQLAADQPDMLLWILACLADSALAMHHWFVGSLSREQLERFWDEYLLVGELFGLDREHAPSDYRAFRGWFQRRFASGELFVTDEAREIGRHVAFELPLPARRRAALPAINLAVAGTLPPAVRAMYRIPWSAAHDAALRSLAIGSRLSRPVVPLALRQGACARDYEGVGRPQAPRSAPPPPPL